MSAHFFLHRSTTATKAYDSTAKESELNESTQTKKNSKYFKKEKETEKKAPTNFEQVDRNLINPNDFCECAKTWDGCIYGIRKFFLTHSQNAAAKNPHRARQRGREKKSRAANEKTKTKETPQHQLK